MVLLWFDMVYYGFTMVLLWFNMGLLWFYYDLIWFCYDLIWFTMVLLWFTMVLLWFNMVLLWFYYDLIWFYYDLIWFTMVLLWFTMILLWFNMVLLWFYYDLIWFYYDLIWFTMVWSSKIGAWLSIESHFKHPRLEYDLVLKPMATCGFPIKRKITCFFLAPETTCPQQAWIASPPTAGPCADFMPSISFKQHLDLRRREGERIWRTGKGLRYWIFDLSLRTDPQISWSLPFLPQPCHFGDFGAVSTGFGPHVAS